MRDADQLTGRIIICAPTTIPAWYSDDLVGTCAFCDRAVRYRPYTPWPRALVCLMCFVLRADPGETCDELGEPLASQGPTC